MTCRQSLYWQDRLRTVYNHDCRSMSELPDNSVQCVVTSPPYWGLRRYAGNQIISEWNCALGLESTPEFYIQHLIEILREIKRVLRPDGVVFWNLGDSYYGSGGDHKPGGKNDAGFQGNLMRGIQPKQDKHDVLKPKDLVLIPERFALAAQADGWYIRSRICWNKPNPMPESVRDRPTDSWEHIWMLTKSARYYYDAEAVKEESTTFDREMERQPHYFGGNKGLELREQGIRTSGAEYHPVATRNLRSVWTFPTQPYKAAHFATFPEELPARCIKAGTSEKGCCPKCGKPWVRIIERKAARLNPSTTYTANTPGNHNGEGASTLHTDNGDVTYKTLGWQPSCQCNAGEHVSCVVLDPFAGSGTTLEVAAKLGRRSVGYEISEEYCRLIVDRNKQGVIL